MPTRIIASLAIFILLGGCGDKADVATIKVPPPVPIEIPKAKPTPEAWKAAVESLYTPLVHQPDGQDEGVTEFTACFGGVVDKHCATKEASAAKRDSFRKLRIYWASWLGTLYGNKLGAYVSLRDNQSPSIVLVPHLFSENGWLFMNQVSVMVDGDVTIDQTFSALDAKREKFPGGYQERMDLVATPTQIEALRKIKPESKVLILSAPIQY